MTRYLFGDYEPPPEPEPAGFAVVEVGCHLCGSSTLLEANKHGEVRGKLHNCADGSWGDAPMQERPARTEVRTGRWAKLLRWFSRR